MRLKANWIKFNTGEKKSFDDKYGNPSPYFRKKFSLKGTVVKARIACSAIGLLKVYINGKEICNDYLTPGWTDYRKRIPYLEVDILDLLKKDNAIGVVAGDGWAVGHVGTDMERCNYFDEVQIAVQIEITYSNGEKDIIVTDDSWKANSGEILRNDIYMGEYIDHRLSLGNFSDFNYDDNNWKNVEINNLWTFNRFTDKMRVPVTTVKQLLKGSLINKIDNTFIYDFGQNMTGVVSAVINGSSGTKLTFKHGEMLNGDGTVYTDNLRKAEATDIYVCSGEKNERFRPLFTFHGFRYMQVTIDGKANVFDVTGEVMYSDIKTTADFSCSDKNVSKLFQNILWSQKDNFVNVPTDCPQRDERLGWLGDEQIFSGTAMFNMDCKQFYEKCICDICDSQLGNGAICGIAPHVPHQSRKVTNMRVSAGWREALVIMVYQHYLMYGDKQIVYETVSNIKRYMSFVEDCMENEFLISEEFGDWLSLGRESDAEVISNMYYAYSALLTYKLCSAIHDEQSEYYLQLFNKLKETFKKRFVSKDNIIKSDTQTVYLLAYAFNLMTQDEIKNNLIRTIHEADDHLTTGFLGIKYLLPVLCEIGESDLAYRMITSTTYPSWCYSVVNGATTIWERWDSFTKENGINNGNSKGSYINVKGMNSFNHYSLGSCGEWFFRYCLGINPVFEDAGFRKVLVKPFVDFSDNIKWAKGYYDSINGKIEVSWEKFDNYVAFDFKACSPMEVVFDFSRYKKIEKKDNGTFFLYLNS